MIFELFQYKKIKDHLQSACRQESTLIVCTEVVAMSTTRATANMKLLSHLRQSTLTVSSSTPWFGIGAMGKEPEGEGRSPPLNFISGEI